MFVDFSLGKCREAHPRDHAPIVWLVGREVHVIALRHAATHQETVPEETGHRGREKIGDLSLNNDDLSNKNEENGEVSIGQSVELVIEPSKMSKKART